MPPPDHQSTSSTTRTLLARAHSPDSTTRILTDKISHRPLFLRPNSPPPQVTARAARRRDRLRKARALTTSSAYKPASKGPKPLSAREKRKLGLYDIPRSGQKYEVFEPLHALWLGYVRELLGSDLYVGGVNAAGKLGVADFHGAEVEVVRSGCVSRVGIKGIVVKDSRFAFEVITRRNRMKLVPKEGSVFRVVVPLPEGERVGEGTDGRKDLVVEVHGSQFEIRAAERSRKLPKTHFLKDI